MESVLKSIIALRDLMAANGMLVTDESFDSIVRAAEAQETCTELEQVKAQLADYVSLAKRRFQEGRAVPADDCLNFSQKIAHGILLLEDFF